MENYVIIEGIVLDCRLVNDTKFRDLFDFRGVNPIYLELLNFIDEKLEDKLDHFDAKFKLYMDILLGKKDQMAVDLLINYHDNYTSFFQMEAYKNFSGFQLHRLALEKAKEDIVHYYLEQK